MIKGAVKHKKKEVPTLADMEHESTNVTLHTSQPIQC